jgi:hypothetical protein
VSFHNFPYFIKIYQFFTNLANFKEIALAIFLKFSYQFVKNWRFFSKVKENEQLGKKEQKFL